MQYCEILPDNSLSHHIESYWTFTSPNYPEKQAFELLLPTCTFNIIITDTPCQLASKLDANWIKISPGAAFFGQRNTSIRIQSKQAINLRKRWPLRAQEKRQIHKLAKESMLVISP